MAKKPTTQRVTSKKPTRPSGNDSDLFDLFEEAKAKAVERDGVKITFYEGTPEERVFIIWPSRFSYQDRQKVARHTGLTPTDAALMLASGQAATEAIAAVLAMAIYQKHGGIMPKMDGVLAWVEQAFFDFEDGDKIPMEVEMIPFEDEDIEDVEDDEGND